MVDWSSISSTIGSAWNAWQDAGGSSSPQSATSAIQAIQQASERTRQHERQLREMEDDAAQKRLEAELQSRLKISKRETAAAMARLEKELQVRREDIANQLTMSRERLGFDREKLAADVEIERNKLALAREEMERIGIPRMEAERWYNEQQVILAQEAQKIDRERIGIERGRLGLEAFEKAVELASSPASKFQFLDFALGLENNAQARDWMAALSDAVNNSGFGVAGDAGTQAISPQEALAAMLGTLTGQTAQAASEGTGAASVPGGGAAIYAPYYQVSPTGQVVLADGTGYGYNDEWSWREANRLARAKQIQSAVTPVPSGAGVNSAGNASADGGTALSQYQNQLNTELAQIAQIADAGASALAPGALESLGEAGLQEFVSGLKKLRRDDVAWLDNYVKTRPYQGGGPEQNWAG